MKTKSGRRIRGRVVTVTAVAFIADERLAFPDGFARIALTLGTVVGVKLHLTQDFAPVTETGHRVNPGCCRIEPPDPGEINGATLHHTSADGCKQFFPGPRAHNGLVHLAEYVVEPVQTADFLLGPVFVKGDLDGRFQVAVIKRLENVAERLDELREIELAGLRRESVIRRDDDVRGLEQASGAEAVFDWVNTPATLVPGANTASMTSVRSL